MAIKHALSKKKLNTRCIHITCILVPLAITLYLYGRNMLGLNDHGYCDINYVKEQESILLKTIDPFMYFSFIALLLGAYSIYVIKVNLPSFSIIQKKKKKIINHQLRFIILWFISTLL